ncbi:hypothetical protein ES708_08200 [subsurface metagenome]
MSESITKLVLGEREFILLGTAHISRESVEEVKERNKFSQLTFDMPSFCINF